MPSIRKIKARHYEFHKYARFRPSLSLLDLQGLQEYLPVGFVLTDELKEEPPVVEIEIPRVYIFDRRFSARYKSGFRKRALSSVLRVEVLKHLFKLLAFRGTRTDGAYRIVPVDPVSLSSQYENDPNAYITFDATMTRTGVIQHRGGQLKITSPTTLQIQFN